MLISSLRQNVFSGITKRLMNSMIAHKFYYGQGGQLQLDLTNRTYRIDVQTVWEDYCQLQIEGLSGVNNFGLYEEDGKAHFNDSELENALEQNIKVKLRIPEDYTMNGTVNGNLIHGAGQVGRKLRCRPFELNITGKNNNLVLGNLQTQKLSISNSQGLSQFDGLTVQQGSIESQTIKCKKMMTSSSLNLEGQHISIRSLLMFGPSLGRLRSRRLLEIDSVSGKSEIQGKEVKIERVYGGNEDINIDCQFVKDKIGIQTGTGSITFPTPEIAQANLNRIILGRMHKGTFSLSGNKITIV